MMSDKLVPWLFSSIDTITVLNHFINRMMMISTKQKFFPLPNVDEGIVATKVLCKRILLQKQSDVFFIGVDTKWQTKKTSNL